MGHEGLIDPLEALSELAAINLDQVEFAEVLQRVANLAQRTIPGAAEVSVTLVQDGKARTAASTGALARDLDHSQYSRGAGPCLDASISGEFVAVNNCAADTRWRGYGPEAARAGAGSSISVGLPLVQALSGALNVYGSSENAFDEDAQALARTFAGYAGVALANAHLYANTAALAQQMQEAMATRAVIEQAKGILMAQHGCNASEAFSMLSAASQRSNRKLRDIASAMVAKIQNGSDGG